MTTYLPHELDGADVVIEPHVGMTYGPSDGARFGVYAYDEYGPTSVLAGQTRRRFLDAYETVEEAREAYPMAEVSEGSLYRPPYLDHLPDDGDY